MTMSPTARKKRQKKPRTSMPTAPPPLPKSFSVTMPRRAIAVTLAFAAAMAFGAGRLTRKYLRFGADTASPAHGVLPPPMVKGRKRVPSTAYTTKNYDTSRSVSSSLFLQTTRIAEPESSPASSPTEKDSTPSAPSPSGEDLHSGEDDLHLPAGQHLLVDFSHVDSSFLDSQSRLAVAMVEMVYECGLTMLSYHCHQLFPSGVSCAGVLLESHVSFHTWPEEGVITLDLFTCGASSLLPMVPMIERLFGISDDVEPRVLWAYKRRGFTDVDRNGNAIDRVGHEDLFAYPLGSRGLEGKREIVSMETTRRRHRVRIYDIVEKRSTVPDRLVFVDGVLRTRSSDRLERFEHVVHPVLLAHPNPRRVAVVSGGADGGGILRQVLAHASVAHAAYAVSEPTMVDLAREHMAAWNECGPDQSCFDDRRAKIASYDDGEWLRGQYDVVIVDSSLLEDDLDESFYRSLLGSLSQSPHGMLAVMTAPNDNHAADSPMRRAATGGLRADRIASDLERAGFSATKNQRGVVVGLVSADAGERFERSELQTRLDIATRIKSPLFHFDGAASRPSSSSTTSAELLDVFRSRSRRRSETNVADEYDANASDRHDHRTRKRSGRMERGDLMRVQPFVDWESAECLVTAK